MRQFLVCNHGSADRRRQWAEQAARSRERGSRKRKSWKTEGHRSTSPTSCSSQEETARKRKCISTTPCRASPGDPTVFFDFSFPLVLRYPYTTLLETSAPAMFAAWTSTKQNTLHEVWPNIFLDREFWARPHPGHHRRAQRAPPPQRFLHIAGAGAVITAPHVPAAPSRGLPDVQETCTEGVSRSRGIHDLMRSGWWGGGDSSESMISCGTKR